MVGGEDTSKKIGITEMMAMESSAVDLVACLIRARIGRGPPCTR